MRLKKLYSSREVAVLTGLSARQLQWWDERHILTSSVPSHKTARGGFTERRYSPIELLELMVLADLRRRGFTLPRLRRLMDVLRSRFQVRLYEAIEGGGPVTLYIDGDKIYARTLAGELFNVLEQPHQALLMVGEEVRLRELTVREAPAARSARIRGGRGPGARSGGGAAGTTRRPRSRRRLEKS
jgi:DNA-binding transcriptional MerR regulator